MRIGIIGMGYVGCVSMACFLRLGHDVIGVDNNQDKVDRLNRGEDVIVEPQVHDMIRKYGGGHATTDMIDVCRWADVLLVCVGTPSKGDGSIDTSSLEFVVKQLNEHRRHVPLTPILVRSTALPSVHSDMIKIVGGMGYCVHPEFLREGTAVEDFMHPAKIVYGGTSDIDWLQIHHDLYPPHELSIEFIEPSVHFTDPMTAAMLKYTDNLFHATKITFANEIGKVCKEFGIDARKVMDLFCQDTKLNISSAYLKPAMPYGGSCLPKDVKAITSWFRENHPNPHLKDVPLLFSLELSNDRQIWDIVEAILLESDVDNDGGGFVGIFGLAFKDNTDDLRNSPMVRIANMLTRSLNLRIYDPWVDPNNLLGANKSIGESYPDVLDCLTKNILEVVECSTIVVARPFPEIDWGDLPFRDCTIIDLFGSVNPADVKVPVKGLYW